MSTNIEIHILNELSVWGKASLRLRRSPDSQNSPTDKLQRMLNAVEPGTVMPIHLSSDAVILLVRIDFKHVF